MAKIITQRARQVAAPEPAPILVADDSATDIHLLQLAFERACVPGRFVTAGDGEEVIQYLLGVTRPAGGAAKPMPKLLILDLKMPRMDGFEVVAWMKRRPEFRHLPVVLLTGSWVASDRLRAIDLGVDEFIVKPLAFSRLVQIAKGLARRWLALPSPRGLQKGRALFRRSPRGVPGEVMAEAGLA